MKNSIFVSIAAYRDPELIPTLDDLINNSKYPKRLKICVGWQYADSEKNQLDKYKDDPRFIIIPVPHNESKGACWMRSEIQQRYTDETWFFQLDSHHRFVQDWDEKCITMINSLKDSGIKKPLLTSYIPSYNPKNDPAERIQEPWRLDFDRIIPEGAVFMLPAAMTEQEKKAPLPTRFFSAHFVFADGKFVKEVPYDPYYFFHGEEINMAIRSYTHGYDLFSPNIVIAWHEYTREGRTKFWDDNDSWLKLNASCHRRNRVLFQMDGEKQNIDFGPYGLGTERSIDDYEEFAGLSLRKRAVQKWTLDHKPPPDPTDYQTQEEYRKSFSGIFKHCIDLYKSSLKPDFSVYDFWCVVFKKNGQDVYRKDCDSAEIMTLYNNFKHKDWLNLWREFFTDVTPDEWVVWPHLKDGTWCDIISGKLGK